MLNHTDALRLVATSISELGVPIVITEVWGDDLKFVVFTEPAGHVLVNRTTGYIEQSVTVQALDQHLAEMVRIPWQPYRPVDPSLSSTRIRKCRRCGGRLLPIIWGMPGYDLVEQSKRGLVALGGCEPPMPWDPHPLKSCRDCGWELVVEPNVAI